jgi:glycosyltransferase involved in cell wall biosynthesis
LIEQKKIYILLPGFNNDSPVKGSAALANELSKKYKVTIVSLKSINSSIKLRNSNNLKLIDLGKLSWLSKFFYYKKLITENYKTNSNISISFCFSADILNSFCTHHTNTFSSVRANLYENYKHSYGVLGFLLAKINFLRLKKITNIFAMTESMAKQIKNEIGLKSHIVGNFLDEDNMEPHRRKNVNNGSYKFVFTGTLSSRKKVEVLINAIDELHKNGHNISCDILGDGPFKKLLINKISDLHLSNIITMHGNILNPFNIVSGADVFVLPSLSEGLSRSSMEALYLGVPCILRDIDGNSELIDENINGNLFTDESEVADLMIRCAQRSRQDLLFKNILLKDDFRQSTGSAKVERLIGIK